MGDFYKSSTTKYYDVMSKLVNMMLNVMMTMLQEKENFWKSKKKVKRK